MTQDFEDRLRAELQQLARDAEPPPTLSDVVAARMPGPDEAQGPRRRLMLAAAAVIVVILASVAIVTTRNGHSRRLVVSAPTTSTDRGSTTTESIPTTTTPQSTSSPLVVPPPTTAAPARGSTTTTRQPPSTTTSTTPSQSGACLPADLQSKTASDQAIYSLGQTVVITVAVRNISTRRCQIQMPYPETFGSTVKITNGGVLVWAPGPHAVGILAFPTPKVLDPGGSYLWTTVQWDQRSCTDACAAPGAGPGEGAQVPAGTYQAQPNNGLSPPSPASPATFRIG